MITHTQVVLGVWAASLASLALFAGWREHRRARRTNPDAVGLIAWPTVQILALIGLAICGLLAMAR